MKTNLKTKRLNLIIGILLTCVSIALLIYGYKSKIDVGVTANDTLIIYSLIALIIGVILVLTSLYLLIKKQSTANESHSDQVKTMTQAALLAAL